jgi:hypothetical protein
MTEHFDESPLGIQDTQAQAVSSALVTDLFRVAVLRWGVLLSTGYLLLWGITALATRFATGVDSARWWWGGIGLVVVWAVACWLGWRERPSASQARAVVDGRRKLGGLLMAQEVDGFDVWAQRLSIPTPLRVRWRGGQTLTAMGLSAVFLIGALVTPMPKGAGAALAMNVQKTIDSLEDQVQVLEEERIIDQPKAEAMRDDMTAVAEDAMGADPSRTWEALDHMGDQLDKTAAEAADDALRRMEDSKAAKALAQAMELGQDRLSEEQMSSAMQALAEMTEQAMGEDMAAELSAKMAEALSQASAAGLDAETLKQLVEMMKGQEAELQAMLDALESARLIEGRLSDSQLELDAAELLEWLESQGEGECDAAKIVGACRGGIDRGPGHVEMIWKDPSSKEGTSFEPKVLPPSRMRDMENARLLGVSRAAPDTEDGGSDSAGGALTGVSSAGGSAESAVILPRHRGAVQRYFQRSVLDTEEPTQDPPGTSATTDSTPDSAEP